MRSRSGAALLFTGIIATLPCAPAAHGESPGADDSGLTLHHASWSAEAWSHHATGELGWVTGSDGSLRLELGLAENGPGPDPLLDQIGEGWTLILGPDGQGTLNTWHREWRRVDGGLGTLAAEAVAFMSAAGPEDERLRVEIPDLDADGSPATGATGFRGAMAHRGRGRGGPGEVVILDRLEIGPESSWAYEIRSTRRPGRIRVGPSATMPLACPVPEVFLPLWPLSEICEKTNNIPGTSAGTDR